MRAVSIRVTGIVQGVGFRPTVWRHARKCEITGEVWNDAEGVVIHAWGKNDSIDRFVERIRSEPPPLARIDNLFAEPLPNAGEVPEGFTIVASQTGQVNTDVAADAATCDACMQEVLDPHNRRYRYPFTNCTHCGPRLSIIEAIPYDRAHTSMRKFPMCAECESEYLDPADRRFHAQPNACWSCGPRVWLEDREGLEVTPEKGWDVIQQAAALIRQGKIVAIKGIGGIHLACDAGNEQSVDHLRQRKQRYHKAFALMARDLEMVSRYADVGEVEKALLQERVAPIVIMEATAEVLPPGIAPGQHTRGFMLPYTPLHHLLMLDLDRPVVLTSGNISDEPQTTGNQEAHRRLGAIADYYLLHDRDIVNRLDDSVVRVMDRAPRYLRRARGYAPQPIQLGELFADDTPILAMGGELKNTFCLLRQGKAVLSQHMGDLEEAETFRDYRHNLMLYRQMFEFEPQMIAVDRHPNYLSTQLGQQLAEEWNIPCIEVQHHHAHIVACMAEHGVRPEETPVLGIALDGLGYGENGTLWGGEFLRVDYDGFQRLARFAPVPMLGGVQAIREPWRNTFAHLNAVFEWEDLCHEYTNLEIIRYLKSKPVTTLQTMLQRGLNSPLASSAGRLFDGVAAAVGLSCERVSFEGQAAIQLEALATEHYAAEAHNAYSTDAENGVLVWRGLWAAILNDLKGGVVPGVIAARFHQGVVAAVVRQAATLCEAQRIHRVILSGGVFQNRLLLEGVSTGLRQVRLEVYSPQQTPVNDGGIALGQAVIALSRYRNGQESV